MRRLFRVLYGNDQNVLFGLFVRVYWPKATITNNVIQAIMKSKKGSEEWCVLQAILHGSFMLEELKVLLIEHEEIMDGFEPSAER